jgi:predicted RecA/RadA family phage recombinase
MAANMLSPDSDRVTILAPANVASGAVVVRNNIVGVAIGGAASGEAVAIAGSGVVKVLKSTAASEVFAIGANVHWDATNARATISATSNARLGVARDAVAANTETTVNVILPGTVLR